VVKEKDVFFTIIKRRKYKSIKVGATNMRLKFEDMRELRRRVVELVNEEKVRIRWEHIRPRHDLRRHEILVALRYGTPLKPDREVEGRYVTWSKLTEEGRVIRIVFEVQKINGELVVVVTAFGEEE